LQDDVDRRFALFDVVVGKQLAVIACGITSNRALPAGKLSRSIVLSYADTATIGADVPAESTARL